jgi:hypothetical protein
MTDTEQRWEDLREGWGHLGRAAEHFARRVAHDARRFAERIEEHVGDLAKDVRREWPGSRGHHGSAEEVRRVFEDVRGVLAAVIEGVDDLVTDLFSPPGEEGWKRIVSNRDVACGRCGRTVAAGDEVNVRGVGGGREFRCLPCGVPGDETHPA